MSYAELYDSFLQHPLLLWVAAIAGLWLALLRRGLTPGLRRFSAALTIISLLDAWLTSNQVVGIGALTGLSASLIPLAFVLIGDFRYFFFIETAGSDGGLQVSASGLARACGWTLVVPLGSELLVRALGSDDPRVLFLVYEALFVIVSGGIAALYLPRRAGAVRWTRRVTLFVITYYGLWAASDAVIVGARADWGFLLRVFPNVLYYGGLVPMIAWAAPREASGNGKMTGHPAGVEQVESPENQ